MIDLPENGSPVPSLGLRCLSVKVNVFLKILKRKYINVMSA
jgi:hypothetical protein